MKPRVIAQVAHEINRAYCASLGDVSQAAWSDAPEWQRQSAMAGVAMHIANPTATPADSHASWLAEKIAAGWIYGPVKDADKKEHPCCVPYDELPAEQKAKDYLFRAVVHQLVAIAPEPASTAAAAAPIKQAATELANGFIAVTYMGRRDTFLDRLYGSKLEFRQGQTRALPPELARRLLNHADQFERAVIKFERAADPLPEAEPEDNTTSMLAKAQLAKDEAAAKQLDLQGLYDQVATMNKAALAHFAKVNYRQEIKPADTLASLRQQVIGFIDQYGAV